MTPAVRPLPISSPQAEELLKELTKIASDPHTTSQVKWRLNRLLAKLRTDREATPIIKEYQEAAKGMPGVCEGELEVDDNPVVSLGDDDGAYVQAWLWVPMHTGPAKK